MAPSDLSIARSTLVSGFVSLFLETLIFGTFVVAYGITTWILLFREESRGRTMKSRAFFGGSTAMFVLALIHLSIDVHINLRALLTDGHDLFAMAHVLDVYNGLVDPMGAVKFAIYVTQTLIGDGFMIYRAYVVWNRDWAIAIVPGVLLLAEVGKSPVPDVQFLGYVSSGLGTLNVGESRMTDCVNAFFVLSVVTNVTSTALIMKRILWSQASIREQRARGSQLKSVRWRVVESLVQSAAIYSIASISLAVTSFLSPSIGFPACHSVFPSIIGLVFVLIVIRISLNAGMVDVHRQTMRHSMVEGAASCTSLPGAMQGLDTQQYHTTGRPIAIKVSVSTTSDTESALSEGAVVSLDTTLGVQTPDCITDPFDVDKTRSSFGSTISAELVHKLQFDTERDPRRSTISFPHSTHKLPELTKEGEP
ncbi:hypothetical protein C8Q78DRAFT_993167 [Trametes maxima]|nr:hypothetical protein C8Q78DRAFT_993167 [Trametes maxima]